MVVNDFEKNLKCVNVKEYPEFFDYAINLILEEWVEEGKRKQKREKILNEASQETFVVLKNKMPVGCFVICKNDIKNRPELNPNLACVCVEKKHRGKGYSLFILNESKKKLKELGYKQAYLKTDLENFYEKVGWVKIETGVESIYKIDL